jgi:hypothetical protein
VNPEIESFYQDVGRAAVAIAPDMKGKLLVYAEVEDGVISCDVFYDKGNNVVKYKVCPEHLRNSVYSLWEKWRAFPGNEEWRALSYVVNNGKFTIDLTYPSQMKSGEELSDRRPRVIKLHFGQSTVDYSKPK